MDVVVIILSIGIVCCMSFMCGTMTRQRKTSRKAIKIPNPVKAIKEHNEEKKAFEDYKKETEIYNTILNNIDNYDGTSRGQKEIPSR